MGIQDWNNRDNSAIISSQAARFTTIFRTLIFTVNPARVANVVRVSKLNLLILPRSKSLRRGRVM
jgi:hypothetical protein